MPVKTIVTCDVCGQDGDAYPSFFEFRNVNEGAFVATNYPLVAKRAEPLYEISTRGVARYDLRICLCRAHFDGLTAACSDWLARARQEAP